MRKISEVMTRQVQVARPEDTLQSAARMMADQDIGSLPVCDGTRLLGMITDRDITVRAVVNGKTPHGPVHEVMSADLCWCSVDDTTKEVLEKMGERQIRRMPVIDADRNLVGIVALGDLALEDEDKVDEALHDISMPA